MAISGPKGDRGFPECKDIFALDDIPDEDMDLKDFATFQRLFTVTGWAKPASHRQH